MKVICGENKYSGFSSAIHKAEKHNVLIRNHIEELKVYANIRNFLVHEYKKLDQDLVVVSKGLVDNIESFEKSLNEPKRVIPQFQNEVVTFQTKEKINNLLKIVKEKEYTQFPIYNGDAFVGIITSTGITRWLAENVEEDMVVSEIPLIQDIIPFEEKLEAYVFVDKNLPVYDVAELFKNKSSDGSRIEMVLITKNGKPNEKLLGVITPFDLIVNS